MTLRKLLELNQWSSNNPKCCVCTTTHSGTKRHCIFLHSGPHPSLDSFTGDTAATHAPVTQAPATHAPAASANPPTTLCAPGCETDHNTPMSPRARNYSSIRATGSSSDGPTTPPWPANYASEYIFDIFEAEDDDTVESRYRRSPWAWPYDGRFLTTGSYL